MKAYNESYNPKNREFLYGGKIVKIPTKAKEVDILDLCLTLKGIKVELLPELESIKDELQTNKQTNYQQISFFKHGVEVVLTYDGKILIVEAVNYKDKEVSLKVEIDGGTYDCENMEWKGFISNQTTTTLVVILNNTYKYFQLTMGVLTPT
jgi:hypothetical protein